MKMNHWAFCLQAVTANPAQAVDSRPCCYLLVVWITWFLTSSSGASTFVCCRQDHGREKSSPPSPRVSVWTRRTAPLHTVTSNKGCLALPPLWRQESSTWREVQWDEALELQQTQSLARIPLLTSNEKLNTIKTILALCIIMQTPSHAYTLLIKFHTHVNLAYCRSQKYKHGTTLLSTQDAKIPHLSALHIPRHVALGAASICRGTLTSSSWSLSLSSYHSCQQLIKAQHQRCISHIPSSKPPEGFFKRVANQKHLLQITF